MRILDGDKEIVANIQSLDRWTDGSIRWMRVDLIADRIPAKCKKKYTVEFGQKAKRTRSPLLYLLS